MQTTTSMLQQKFMLRLQQREKKQSGIMLQVLLLLEVALIQQKVMHFLLTEISLLLTEQLFQPAQLSLTLVGVLKL
jgi:hypothetical protein